jgi:hypothetical protein
MKRWVRWGLLAAMILYPAVQYGQKADFSGIRIFINPGHGGHDDNDRHMLATDFWESDGNLEKGLFLRELLEARNATVAMSRTTNYTSDDLALSTIAEMANTFNADFFLSIHSNGFDGTRNQPLVLFRGYDDQPVYPASKTMALILWGKLFEKGNCWTHTSEWVKGDWTFYPDWGDKVGLGVLRTLALPGVLSEGSFHDYVGEGWRLRNNNHLHHEAWAMLRALEEFENVVPEQTGIVAGTVRDELTEPEYYFRPGSKDENLPINGGVVTLLPVNRSVTIDNLNNGFFLFDSVAPGDYKVVCSGMADFYNDTLNATVIAGKTTLVDLLPSFDTARVPVVTGFMPVITDSLAFNQVFTFTFNVPMDRNAVEAALVIEPSAGLLYEWDEKGKVMTVKPETGFASKTNYTMRLTTAAHSFWKVPLGSEYQVSFVTKSRTKLVTEMIWPSSGMTAVTLYPRITLKFDAPLDQVSAGEGIRLIKGQSEVVGKLRETFTSAGGKGTYSFELAQALQLNSQYRLVVDATVKDIAGVTTGTAAEVTFTTRTGSYQSGNIIENFENISAFWDPEASGSTIGTDNPLTTFTPSYNIIRSGTTAGRLDYVFTGDGGGVCRVFDTGKPLIGSNTSLVFGMWVYGDLSHNQLEYWFYAPGTVNQIVVADEIDWAGWDLITIPFSSIGGSGPWQYHSLVVRQAAGAQKAGTMYFDDATVITLTGITEEESDDTGLLLYPNPVQAEGKVTFSLGSPSYVEINLYSSDGSLAASLFNGYRASGSQTVEWSPSPAMSSGVYTLRLSLRREGESTWHHSSQRCVVVR